MTTQPEKNDSRDNLEGAIPSLATTQERNAAMDHAFDYRGDVTLHTQDGQVIEGYVYDRCSDHAEPYVRIMPKDGSPRKKILYCQIDRLHFSGKDTAAGKSWETWVKKYQEKKARGESANIEAESLD